MADSAEGGDEERRGQLSGSGDAVCEGVQANGELAV
jgi:hypothetical protein